MAAIILVIIGTVIFIYNYYWAKATERQIDMETFLTAHGHMKKPETDYRKYWEQQRKNYYTALVLIIVALLLCSIQFVPKVRIYEIARQELIQEHKLGNDKERQQINSIKTLILKRHEND